eukprot:TRINITY_DN8006_c0_g2_i16.p1 TRINITY_DN8006_c0_g2~~TRINITY_DN8006_c0_g2_i16.p1  ORF type:complete len:184 (-),score=11.50 TRINITY_DN8006_c0_g2_i16:92-622(-)
MIRRPPRSTHCISSAASDVYKRQLQHQLHHIVSVRILRHLDRVLHHLLHHLLLELPILRLQRERHEFLGDVQTVRVARSPRKVVDDLGHDELLVLAAEEQNRLLYCVGPMVVLVGYHAVTVASSLMCPFISDVIKSSSSFVSIISIITCTEWVPCLSKHILYIIPSSYFFTFSLPF